MLVVHIAFWVISLVLIGSGAAKIAEPGSFARFVSSTTGRGVTATVTRAVALVEICLGLAGLVLAGRIVAALVGAAYLLFSVVVVVAIRSDEPTCGCFGAASSRPNPVHLVANIGSCVVALVGAIAGVPPMADGLSGLGAGGIAVVCLVIASAGGVIFVDTR